MTFNEKALRQAITRLRIAIWDIPLTPEIVADTVQQMERELRLLEPMSWQQLDPQTRVELRSLHRTITLLQEQDAVRLDPAANSALQIIVVPLNNYLSRWLG